MRCPRRSSWETSSPPPSPGRSPQATSFSMRNAGTNAEPGRTVGEWRGPHSPGQAGRGAVPPTWSTGCRTGSSPAGALPGEGLHGVWGGPCPCGVGENGFSVVLHGHRLVDTSPGSVTASTSSQPFARVSESEVPLLPLVKTPGTQGLLILRAFIPPARTLFPNSVPFTGPGAGHA